MKRPTQTDVARIAGVSRATVSLIVNDQEGGRIPISEDTRMRVQAAIAELGYVPDASARALRTGGTKTIGFVLPDINNPHFWDNVDGVEREARELGYHLLLSNLSSKIEYSEKVLKDLTNQHIDGLILQSCFIDMSPIATRFLEQCVRRRFPLIEISDDVNLDHHIDRVVANYRQATLDVVDYLIQLGHRRIGFVYGVAQHELGLDRLESFEEAFRIAGLPLNPDWVVFCGPAIEDGYNGASRLLQLPERPTAILTINDLLAIGAARAATDLGIEIPSALSLVGFDDIFASRYLVPRLTTVSKDAIGIGRAASRLLIERIDDPSLPCRTQVFPACIIVRESTGPV
jgi:LacI family transcriptional regulator